MRPIEIALIDTTNDRKIDRRLMAATVAALNVQVTQHLPRYWRTAPAAIVRQLNKHERLPLGVWPIMLVDSLPNDVGGFHYTSHNQPAAKIVAKPDSDHWTIDASHEALEMLIDPSGNRLQAAQAIELLEDGTIADADGELEYLLEICDPCEGKQFAYRVQDIWMSDFVTPDFYADSTLKGLRWSFSGSVEAPRRICQGGYITWVAGASRIQQMKWIGTDQPNIHEVGTTAHAKGEGKNIREFVDCRTRHEIHSRRPQADKHDRYISKHTPFKLDGEMREPVRYRNAHTVVYHKDGEIEREVWDEGASQPRKVIERVRAGEIIRRPEGTRHSVRNLGEGLLDGGKDMVHPE
jgi:mannose-6-phosphate isomerase-like protein (cupin superfamily)